MSREHYYMNLAIAARKRANCLGSRVGAVLVLDDRVIATGYNGTPMGMTNCDEGGCDRCSNREKYPRGEGYDVCICAHAEQNALLTAARFGIAVRNAIIYTTTRPCFGCTKELLQAEVTKVYYIHDWSPCPDLRDQYELIQKQFIGGIEKLDMDDPETDWAMPSSGFIPDETGHTMVESQRDEESGHNHSV
jgi:dCMP deaminase